MRQTIIAVIIFTFGLPLAASAETTITYQGQLQHDDDAFDGIVDEMQFKLFDAKSDGNQIHQPVIKQDVEVNNGLFQVKLDFGNVAYEDGLWLEIEINNTTLSERQRIAAVPIATHSISGGYWSVMGDDNIYYEDGRVGIGTPFPFAPLHTRGQDASLPLFIADHSETDGALIAMPDGGMTIGELDSNPPPQGLKVYGDIQGLSNITINSDADIFGDIRGNSNISVNADASQSLSYIRFRGSSGTSVPRIYHSESSNSFNFRGADEVRVRGDMRVSENFRVNDRVTGSLDINDDISINADASSTRSYIRFRGDSGTDVPRIYHSENNNGFNFNGMELVRVWGTMRSDVVEVSGADLAEEFPLSQPAEPGTVLAIDPDNPGELRPTSQEYDRGVAGVVPGADKLDPGIVLGRGTGNEHASPVALSGRVYVNAIAVKEIRPGDFLTSSNKPGYARVASDKHRRQGAIIGKAMESLPKGHEGQILVLVNLQ